MIGSGLFAEGESVFIPSIPLLSVALGVIALGVVAIMVVLNWRRRN
jgi:hypothetical protein